MVGIVARETSPKRTNRSKRERAEEPEKSPKRTRSVQMMEYAIKVSRGNARDCAFEKLLGFGSGLASTPEADETVASTPETAASVASIPETAVGSASTSGTANALPNGWVIGYAGNIVYLDPKKRAYRPPPTPPTPPNRTKPARLKQLGASPKPGKWATTPGNEAASSSTSGNAASSVPKTYCPPAVHVDADGIHYGEDGSKWYLTSEYRKNGRTRNHRHYLSS